jgi:hypothetical protein
MREGSVGSFWFELFETRLKGHRESNMRVEELRACDDRMRNATRWYARHEDTTMLEEGKISGDTIASSTRRLEIRMDAFKRNAGGDAQECAQLALERGAPHSIVRTDRYTLRS